MKLTTMLRVIGLVLFLTIASLLAFAQTKIEGQTQVYTNETLAGPVQPGIIEGTTNQVPVQPWRVQVIEVITILRSERVEFRVTLPNQPLLSVTNETIVPRTNHPARIRPKPTTAVPLGPPAPKTKPKP